MATTVDELLIEIKAETQGLRKGLQGVEDRLKDTNKAAKSSLLTFSNLTKVFAGVGVFQLGKQITSTTRTFEDLQATLKAVTGSNEAAAKSFDFIRKFTGNTTFQLENVTEGFITLVNAGIVPSAERLTAFGNVAAAFNKDITEITKAVFNATTGEMEMLKQFGIKAKQNTDTIDVTFGGATQTIEKTSEAIVDFVTQIGETRFPTALQDRAETLSGAISNMIDSFSEFFFAIGEGGLKDVMTEVALATKDMLDEARPLAAAVGAKLKVAFDGLKIAIQFVVDNMNKLLLISGLFMALGLATTLLRAGIAAAKMARSIGLLKVAMIALNKVSKGNIIMLIGVIAAEQLGLLDAAAERVGGVLESLGEKFTDFMGLDDSEGTEESLNSLSKEMEELITKFQEGTADAKSLDAVLKLAEGNIKQLAFVYEGLNAALANGTITLDQANAKLRDFLRSTGPFGTALAEIADQVETLSDGFASDFVNALMEGESAMDSFKNFAKQVVAMVISTFMKLLVIQPIVDAILGAFNLSGTKGAPITPTATATGDAGGGTMQANRPRLVGERGPELFIPNVGGTLLNNMNTKGAMGGQSIVVNQSLNFSTGVVPTVRAEITKMMPQINDATKAAVLEAAARGGAYRRGLLGT